MDKLDPAKLEDSSTEDVVGGYIGKDWDEPEYYEMCGIEFNPHALSRDVYMYRGKVIDKSLAYKMRDEVKRLLKLGKSKYEAGQEVEEMFESQLPDW